MINFYKNKVALNCLAKDVDNAKEIYDAIDGHVLIGVLSKDFADVLSAKHYIDDLATKINNAVSVGLGAGDPKQSNMVTQISQILNINPHHINQVFTGVNGSKTVSSKSLVNALVSPTGTPGIVRISTGMLSSEGEAIIKVEDAIRMIKDMGGSSIKYYPMKGLKTKEEFIAIAKACGEHNFSLEPTGGLNLDNLEEILEICKSNNVPKVIPHVYTSIMDKESKKTKVEDVKKIFSIFKKIYGQW